MTKYNFNTSNNKGPVSSAPQQQSLPFDLEQQMRQFMVEKRSAGLQHQISPLTPTSYNTQKQLPIPPSPPSRKLLRLTSKSKRFMAPVTRGVSTLARTGPEIRSVPHPGRIRNHHPSASAPSLVSPGEMKNLVDSRQKRPSSFIAPETPNDIFWPGIGSPGIYPKKPWKTPENSPLLPPPRGAAPSRTIPPPIHVSASAAPRKTTPVQIRNKTSEIFGSALSMYPNAKKQPPSARSNPDILQAPNSNGITPRRITIDSVEMAPRTPPPPPTPAKSLAQRQRARPTQPLSTPTQVSVGYVAELTGSEVDGPTEIGPVELMGDIAFPSPAPVIMAPVPQKRRRVKASSVNSKVKQRHQQPKPPTPEGKEIYAHMPLPDVPESPSPPVEEPKPVPESSPVLEVDFECFNDGLVEWFNNFNWSESGDLLVNTTSRVPKSPGAGAAFNVETRASVVDPDGAVVNSEPTPPPTIMLSPKTPGETALLSPVYPVSPRLTSYYGARASFASSVGDAFRFDEDEGCALSDVDERYEDELDVDEMYEEQFLGESQSHESENLQFEIEMILNGAYDSGSPDDWREGIYSAESSESSVDVEEVIADYWTEEEREGDIVVGLMPEGEEGLDWSALEGVWEDELQEIRRPRTRYLAGRNSAIEGDVVFCLKSAELERI